MVTKEKVEEMCWYVLSLIEQYKEKTDKFKETPQLDGAEYIWCKGWRAPHEPIFFEEATCGNISEPRHPIAKTPRKRCMFPFIITEIKCRFIHRFTGRKATLSARLFIHMIQVRPMVSPTTERGSLICSP